MKAGTIRYPGNFRHDRCVWPPPPWGPLAYAEVSQPNKAS
jgi:hypothetical protein